MKQRLSCVKRAVGYLRNVSVFWKHLLMMIIILLLCLSVMLLIYQLSTENLIAENVEKMQLALERDSHDLSSSMYSTFNIPVAIEESRNYKYIRYVKQDVLETKYHAVLSILRQTLSKLAFLKGDSEECILYFSNINSICTPSIQSSIADEHFRSKLVFAESTGEEILNEMNTRGNIALLPSQNVHNRWEHWEKQCIGLIVRPKNSNLAVLTVYQESYVLDALGFHQLPEGSVLEIRDREGELVLRYPETEISDGDENFQVLKAELKDIEARVTAWVPVEHFFSQIGSYRTVAIFSMILLSVLGVAIALLFSRASVSPIRGLLDRHSADDSEGSVNEITQLDRLLIGAQQKAEQMHSMMMKQLLTRILSGNVPTERDEEQLLQELPELARGYRVAVLHAAEEVNELLGDHLSRHMENLEYAWLSPKETGVVMPGSEKTTEILKKLVDSLNSRIVGSCVICGISAPAAGFSGVHKAVRQARASLPAEGGVKVFPGEMTESASISWVQHERLYQSISACDEEDACRVLESISAMTNHLNCREVYYNVRFVLRSAAEDMEISLPGLGEAEYSNGILPQENLHVLSLLMRSLFEQIRDKNRRSSDDRVFAVLGYIQKNVSDFNICAATTAEYFGMTERKMYDFIRKQTGMSFNEYLTPLRMKLARQLLCTTTLGVGAIGQKCGYRIPGTFYRVFREQCGVSPGQYREQNRRGNG